MGLAKRWTLGPNQATLKTTMTPEYDLKLVDPNKIDANTLDDLFWKHHGKGPGSLTVGGIKVTKSIDRYSSNSGKSKDWRVTFTWTNSDGMAVSRVKESRYEDNRRNDAERNWGLPE